MYNNYLSQENIENDPPEVIISDVERVILDDKPRITRFNITWTGEHQEVQQEQDKNYNQTFMFPEQ